jgi:hypothetical protein
MVFQNLKTVGILWMDTAGAVVVGLACSVGALGQDVLGDSPEFLELSAAME